MPTILLEGENNSDKIIVIYGLRWAHWVQSLFDALLQFTLWICIGIKKEDDQLIEKKEHCVIWAWLEATMGRRLEDDSTILENFPWFVSYLIWFIQNWKWRELNHFEKRSRIKNKCLHCLKTNAFSKAVWIKYIWNTGNEWRYTRFETRHRRACYSLFLPGMLLTVAAMPSDWVILDWNTDFSQFNQSTLFNQ